ncbi:uncharacterized protein LOC111314084 [Durio zibethinus]|uniref:Uncharacterized protein LOC111314084 n=1 Tax=Durio zibethinus TaxID=66656 RepID=A0A6P6B149_DURZI|nr:uncharacterized protein LOC111314084 [Durio zibethinus]
MGNYISTVTCRPSDTAGKIILWDGSVQEFSWPLTAAELMLEHPQQVVVEFHAAVNEKRPIPLPADQKLDVKKVYILLPVKRGKPAMLSSEEARRVLLSANSVLKSKSLLSSSKFLPWFANICPAIYVEEIGQEFPLQKKENVYERPEEVRCLTEVFPESLESRPDYLNKQYSGKGWKPTLDPIKEKKVERKVPHWLY